MSKIKSVKRVINEEQDGELARVDRMEYDFDDEATEWEKEAVREYGCTSKDEFQDAIAWREAIDELAEENEKLARVQRGKHPTKDKDVGRPKTARNRPDHAGPE